MIKLTVSHTGIRTAGSEKLVTGNVNSIFVQFFFSPEWESLTRVAVFSNGETRRAVPLSSDVCVIPWEVLSEVGELFVALRGTDDGGNFVLCTENEFLGIVHRSNAVCSAGESESPPSDLIAILLAGLNRFNDALADGGIGWTEDSSETITWDGDTTGKTVLDLGELRYYVKLSDDIVTAEALQSGRAIVSGGGTTLAEVDLSEAEITTEADTIIATAAPYFRIVCALADGAEYQDGASQVTFPTSGIYALCFGSTDSSAFYVSELSYGSEIIHPIDPKFLPDPVDAYTKAETDAKIAEAIGNAIGGLY